MFLLGAAWPFDFARLPVEALARYASQSSFSLYQGKSVQLPSYFVASMPRVYDLSIALVVDAVGVREVATGRGTEEREKVNKIPLPNLAVWRRAVFHLGAALLLMITTLGWNRPALPQDERKIKSSVQPRYPELARQNNLYGSARLQVRIARDGTVKEIKVLGGSPLLVQASIEAVKQWRYEPASVESNIILKFDFKP